MLRQTEDLKYELTLKKIKNIILKVDSDNNIRVSAPYNADKNFIDQFVLSRRAFIEKAMRRNGERIPIGKTSVSDAEIYRKLHEILVEEYKLFSQYGFKLPQMKIRDMKSQWGNCRSAQGIITLNKRLYILPRRYIEFVAAHELAHMVEANHSAAFYRVLEGVMPDSGERAREIRIYKLT
jgi:hypothetical protein